MSESAAPRDQEPSPPEPPELPELPELPRDGSRRRRLLTRIALYVGLVLVGAGATYLLVPPVAAPPEVTMLDLGASSTEDDAGTSATTSMPSLAGLALDTAELALRDAGFGDVQVTTSTADAAGPPGLVLEQEPSAGTAAVDQIHLTLSAEVAMPDLTGQAFDDALSELERLGAVVTTSSVIRPEKDLGTVLGTTPAPGDPLPAVVELRVADPGEALSLDELDTVGGNGRCYDDYGVDVGASTTAVALVCDLTNRPSTVAYQLRGLGLALVFSAGMDAGAGDGTATITLSGDGAPIETIAVDSTSRRNVVDISGVDRLTITITGSRSGDQQPRVVLGNPVVRGTPADITKLADS